MDIRLMTINDYEQVIAVWIAAGLTVDPTLDSKEAIATVLSMNPTSCFVAYNGSAIIGAVLGTYNGRAGWIYHFGVLPEYQNHGIGSALLARTEISLAHLGAKKIVLSHKSGNDAVAPFYRRRGYDVFTSRVLEKGVSLWYDEYCE